MVEGKGYNLSEMKKNGVLICLFLLMLVSRGFALDIYVNDLLWRSYSDSDLHDLRVDLSWRADDNPGVPFPELIPLMSTLSALRVTIPGGDILLEVDSEALRKAALIKSSPKGWDLSLSSSLFHAPSRIDIYGLVNPGKDILIWAEPDLGEIEKQIEVWASLHKVNVLYREVPQIKDELIHRKMTGDLMPDFILRYLSPDEPVNKENTLIYSLESLLAPPETRSIKTLVLPTGFKIHPDLYLSILASLSEGNSPLTVTISGERGSLKRATSLYAGMILSRRIMVKQDFHISKAFREGSYAFFPASSFPLQTGNRLSPGSLEGLDRPLSSRVLPLMFESTDEDFSPGTLLDFLKLPGIQYKFLSLPYRQLPSDISSLDHRSLTEGELNLLNDWRRGFILSRRNYSVSEAVYRNLPDLLRVEGALP